MKKFGRNDKILGKFWVTFADNSYFRQKRNTYKLFRFVIFVHGEYIFTRTISRDEGRFVVVHIFQNNCQKLYRFVRGLRPVIFGNEYQLQQIDIFNKICNTYLGILPKMRLD